MTLALMALTIPLLVVQQPSAALSVRVVDSHLMPLPGISVRLEEVSECTTLTPGGANQHAGTTKSDGVVEFAVPVDRSYRLTVDAQGGLERQDDCIEQLGPGRRYSQLTLRPDLSEQVTLIIPASPARRGAPGLGDFTGVYGSESGQLFEIVLLEGVGGVGLSLPKGGLLRFPRRSGLAFSGQDGTIRFTVQGGHVTGFTVTRQAIRGRRQR